MAAENPNPSRITAEMWWLWLQLQAIIAGVRLGGIYADKSGYHNTVNANLAKWPGNYSVRYAIDREPPRDKARAIDLTMSSTNMKRITRILVNAVTARDPRLRPVKEFYGTLDGSTVVGFLKDSPDGTWRTGTSDSSHTWHEHIGLLTPFVDDMEAMRGLVSLLSGENLNDYMGGTMELNLPKYGDTGTWVKLVQRYVNTYLEAAGRPVIERDGIYRDQTTAALKWWFVNIAKGDPADYDGRYVSDWIFREFLRRDGGGAPTQAQVDAAVAKWFTAHPVAPGKTPTKVTIDFPPITGTVTASQ